MLAIAVAAGGGAVSNWTQSTMPVITCSEADVVSLADGRVAVIGFANRDYSTVNTVSAASFIGALSGSAMAWVGGTAYPAAVSNKGMCLLPDGRVLCVGGYLSGGFTITNVSRVAVVSGNTFTWTTATAYPIAVRNPKITVLNDGRLFAAGGFVGATGITANRTSYIGVVTANAINWTAVTWPAAAAGKDLTSLCTLPDGRIQFTFEQTILLGTVSGNTVSWVTALTLPLGSYIGRGFIDAVKRGAGSLVSIQNTGPAPGYVTDYESAIFDGVSLSGEAAMPVVVGMKDIQAGAAVFGYYTEFGTTPISQIGT